MLTVYITHMQEGIEVAVFRGTERLLLGDITRPIDGTAEDLVLGAIETALDDVVSRDVV